MEQTIVSAINEEARIKRECKGRALCIQRKVNQFLNSDIFYVESESLVGKYYYVKFVYESSGNFWCSCLDYASNRSEGKCKHIFAVQYALRLNLVQKIDHKLPISQVQKNSEVSALTPSKTDDPTPDHSETVKELTENLFSNIGKSTNQTTTTTIAEQYKDLSIATLNIIEQAEIEAEAYSRTKGQSWEDDTYDY